MSGEEMSRIMSSISPKNCALGISDAGVTSFSASDAPTVPPLALGPKLGRTMLLEEDEDEPFADASSCRLEDLPSVATTPRCSAGTRFEVQCEAGKDVSHETRFLSGGERPGCGNP